MFYDDKILVFDKKTHRASVLGNGEVNYGEEGFNFGFTIDGSKDSSKITIWSYEKNPFEPNSIVLHKNTNTWWIIAKDEVSAYYHEGQLIYLHKLQLEGAIELLMARDLTDSGFNGKTYTIDDFIKRLFSLSNFEYPLSINYGENQKTNINGEMLVDYIKTFENYTLGTALREFFNGYNCSVKLTFSTRPIPSATFHRFDEITQANLIIVPKSGRVDLEPISINVFDDVRETRDFEKNNFGTSVISNAQNVISTKSKTYPSVGGAKLSGSEYDITPASAFLKLPSNVYSVNWLKMFNRVSIQIHYCGFDGNNYFWKEFSSFFNPLNKKSIDLVIEDLIKQLREDTQAQYTESMLQTIRDNRETMLDKALKASSITLYGNPTYNPLSSGFPDDTPSHITPPTNQPNFYIPKIASRNFLDNISNIILVSKDVKETMKIPNDAIVWERGSDKITNFNFMNKVGSATPLSYAYTDLGDESTTIYSNRALTQIPVPGDMVLEIGQISGAGGTRPFIDVANTRFQINYVPMSDVKLVIDNSKDSRDIKLYNQNGKLTDSVALSKLILSHSKEVENYKITKYKSMFNFDFVPQVGQIVYEDNKKYIIENVSLDLFMHEEDYKINGIFTLSSNIATKSALVSPNTNIRDYGIPQTQNVVRKQVYRDFYEIDIAKDSESTNDYYMPITKILNLTDTRKEYNEHTALIQATFENGEKHCYQLNTTTYVLKKNIYEVVNFNDNNIIGYDCQSKNNGFDITKILAGNIININTPISYVDDNGRLKDLKLVFVNDSQLVESYEEYLAEQEQVADFSIYNALVYIPNEVFLYSDSAETSDFVINAQNYNKDALEVPFFEYACQIDDSENVEIGENILDETQETTLNNCYTYFCAFVDKNIANNLNATSFAEIIKSQVGAIGRNTMNNGLKISIVNDEIHIEIYENVYRDFIPRFSINRYGNKLESINLNKDMVIFKATYEDFSKDPLIDNLLIVRNLTEQNIVKSGGNLDYIKLFVNHYKL